MQTVDGVGGAVALHADRNLLPMAWPLRAMLSTYDAVCDGRLPVLVLRSEST
jgi:hypothetical protein